MHTLPAGARMELWAGVGRPEKATRKASPRRAMAAGIADAQERQETRRWEDAEPRALVGLYALLHEHVYGVAPDELAEAWPGAVSAAGKLLREDFGGEPEKAVEFLRWVWSRERAREKRRGAGEGGFRIGWRLQFVSRAMLTDWKVDQARGARAVGAAPR